MRSGCTRLVGNSEASFLGPEVKFRGYKLADCGVLIKRNGNARCLALGGFDAAGKNLLCRLAVVF